MQRVIQAAKDGAKDGALVGLAKGPTGIVMGTALGAAVGACRKTAEELFSICTTKPVVAKTYRDLCDKTMALVYLSYEYVAALADNDRKSNKVTSDAVLKAIDKDNRANIDSTIASCDRFLRNLWTLLMPTGRGKITALKSELLRFQDKEMKSVVPIYEEQRYGSSR